MFIGSISNELPNVQFKDLPFQSLTPTDFNAKTLPESKKKVNNNCNQKGHW